LSGIRFRKEFGNIDKFSIKFGCRIIANFEFPYKFGRIAVLLEITKIIKFRSDLDIKNCLKILNKTSKLLRYVQ
jgi:hypothetical protein